MTNKTQSSLRESRIDEIVDELSEGIVETFDSRVDEDDLKKHLLLTFSGEINKYDLEFLNNLMTSNISNKKDVYEVVIEKDNEKYMVGYIRLNNLNKFDTIVDMFSDKAEVELKDDSTNKKIPLSILRNLESSRGLSDEELELKYNTNLNDDRKKIKNNVDLY